MSASDLHELLEHWPYDPARNVRLERGRGGREFLMIRLPMGLEQHEVDGRPDGQRPEGMESVLEVQLSRLASATSAGAHCVFRLTAEDCVALFEEATSYHNRSVNFLQIEDWVRAERDAVRNLRLLDFVKVYAQHEGDLLQVEQWRHDISQVNAVAHAMILLEKGQYDQAPKIMGDSNGEIDGVGQRPRSPRALTIAPPHEPGKYLGVLPGFCQSEESAFIRQGDYWTIIYQGHIDRLKASRGLQYLAYLLRHPGQEFHASDLLVPSSEAARTTTAGERPASSARIALAREACPILDAQAKTEYGSRLAELRADLDEAERLNDPGRASNARIEMNLIADQVASAVGLGGRDRRTGSQAGRVRSAVTKRIRESIARIEEVIPSLGRHLSVSIKTGYLCSYNPPPDRPVTWQF